MLHISAGLVAMLEAQRRQVLADPALDWARKSALVAQFDKAIEEVRQHGKATETSQPEPAATR